MSLKSYLTTCVVNRVRDEFRHKRPETIELDKAGPIGSDSNGPDKQVMANEMSQLVIDALAEIPFEQREVIVMYLEGGMKFREIAAVQKTSISTVHGRYRYGLKKLRIILDGELEK